MGNEDYYYFPIKKVDRYDSLYTTGLSFGQYSNSTFCLFLLNQYWIKCYDKKNLVHSKIYTNKPIEDCLSTNRMIFLSNPSYSI